MSQSLPQDLVIVEDKVPYCDTRVAAKKLGIKHGPFMTNTIMKYQEQVEAKCGQIHFKNEVGYRQQGGGNPERYAHLTELQTNAYLGLVRNTPQSVELKIDLAVAFDKAKKIIGQLLNEQSETIIRQQFQELDPIETAKNPQLLRQAVEQMEDIALAAAKKAQLFKLLEQHYYPSQYKPRGKRNLPQAKPVIWNRMQITQMTIIFEIA